jgi:uncharacterized protein YqjF (DUF2071 family)
MSIENLRFTQTLRSKPITHGLAAETTLEHFAIVTYRVDPSNLRKHLHPRFEPVCIVDDGASRQALVSVVTFLDRDFHFVACPWFKRSFGQTNYRAYVEDTQTGEQVAWFFGTCLDSASVAIPRYVWKLPWHRAHMAFDCRYDAKSMRYSTFNVNTQSRWAPGQLVIEDSGEVPNHLPGVSNLEAGLVLLTHPMRGYFFRQDGSLGSYAIWHDRAEPTAGTPRVASYPLLHRLRLVEEGDLSSVHSVLLQRAIDFTIYLPPSKVNSSVS